GYLAQFIGEVQRVELLDVGVQRFLSEGDLTQPLVEGAKPFQSGVGGGDALLDGVVLLLQAVALPLRFSQFDPGQLLGVIHRSVLGCQALESRSGWGMSELRRSLSEATTYAQEIAERGLHSSGQPIE